MGKKRNNRNFTNEDIEEDPLIQPLNEDALIAKIDSQIEDLDKNICMNILNDTLKHLNNVEHQIKLANYKCKKCLILANSVNQIKNCYENLIEDVENINYSQLLAKLDVLKFCDMRLINHNCHLNALNIQSLHKCINNST